MELDLLQVFGGFGAGAVVGILAMLIFNKIRSGSASAGGVKNEYDEYKNQVEEHFEATSKKFQNMTEQYQDLYQHLAVGATSLCRADSVAAALVDGSDPAKPAQIESDSSNQEPTTSEANTDDSTASETAAASSEDVAAKPEVDSASDDVTAESDAKADAEDVASKS